MKVDPAVKSYIQRKRWSYNDRSSTQYIIKVCPYCGDSGGHFHINKATGQYSCFKCPAEGNLYTLKKNLGDIVDVQRISPSKPKISKERYESLEVSIRQYNSALKQNKKVRKILKEKWNIGLRGIHRFTLGLQIQDTIRWLVIPQYEAGRISNVKYRTIPPAKKQFRREPNMKSILFNIDRINPEISEIYLVEGETDAITADCYLSLPNVLGVTVGARGFKEEWITYLESFEKYYIVYDNDVVGQQGAEKIAFRLGIEKCFNVELPAGETGNVDLTDWVKAGNTRKKFDLLVKASHQFDVEDVSSFDTVLRDIETDLSISTNKEQRGFTTQWEKVNKLLGSFVPGDLIVVSGQAKIGKTTFALNLLLHQAVQNVPVLNYCLEMRKERIVPKIISWFRGISSESITKEDATYVKTMFGKKPFYLAHSYKFTPEDVFETIRTAVRRYGIELMVFDHLHFLVRSIDHVTSEVSAAVRAFKLLAEELKIPIILICQPGKLRNNRRMTVDDLRDSSSIGQDADTVIIVHRERTQQTDELVVDENRPSFSSTAEIIVDATRYNPGGITTLKFNGEISRYFEDTKRERRFLSGHREY